MGEKVSIELQTSKWTTDGRTKENNGREGKLVVELDLILPSPPLPSSSTSLRVPLSKDRGEKPINLTPPEERSSQVEQRKKLNDQRGALKEASSFLLPSPRFHPPSPPT